MSCAPQIINDSANELIVSVPHPPPPTRAPRTPTTMSCAPQIINDSANELIVSVPPPHLPPGPLQQCHAHHKLSMTQRMN